MRHGQSSTYTNQGCRCDACRQAHTDYQRRGRALRREGRLSGREFNPDLADLLAELFPDGLTDDCPARQRAAA